MSLASLHPTLLLLAALVSVGVLLGRSGHLGTSREQAASILTAVVIDVTLPALTLEVLLRRPLGLAVVRPLLPATVGLVASGLAAWGLGAMLRWSRPVRGTVNVCGAFCNTSFLGLPVVRALFPGDAEAAQAAVFIDTVDTTILLWTAGVAIARAFGTARRSSGNAMLGVLLRPATLSVLLGLAGTLLRVPVPESVLSALHGVGAATSVLVFLALGMRLDPSVLAGQRAPLAVAVALKMLFAPAIALGVVLATRGHGAPMAVAVLQASMPSALIAAAIATQEGCDDRLAAAIVVTSLLLAVPALSLWGPVFARIASG